MRVQGGPQKPVDGALSFYPRETEVREVRGLCKDTQLVSGHAGPRTEKPCLLVRCSFHHTMHLLTFTASALSESVNQGQAILPKQKSNYITLCFHTCYFFCLQYSASSRFSVWPTPALFPFPARRALCCEVFLALYGQAVHQPSTLLGLCLPLPPACEALASSSSWGLSTSHSEGHLNVWGGR